MASAAASAKVGGTCAQPPAQVAFRVVKKSLLKAGEELSSGKCGTLPVGTAMAIGKAVSSGCVRLLNQDVIDLYGRVTDGAPILVT